MAQGPSDPPASTFGRVRAPTRTFLAGGLLATSLAFAALPSSPASAATSTIRVSLIGDESMAGLEDANKPTRDIISTTYPLAIDSACNRETVVRPTPEYCNVGKVNDALQTINATNGGDLGEILVMMTGYNDRAETFGGQRRPDRRRGPGPGCRPAGLAEPPDGRRGRSHAHALERHQHHPRPEGHAARTLPDRRQLEHRQPGAQLRADRRRSRRATTPASARHPTSSRSARTRPAKLATYIKARVDPSPAASRLPRRPPVTPARTAAHQPTPSASLLPTRLRRPTASTPAARRTAPSPPSGCSTPASTAATT